MSWDPAILRKFNTTGHFRLLNQLRGELKAHPLPRQQTDGDGAAGGNRGAGTGAIEMRPQPMGYSRSRRSSGYGSPSSKSESFSDAAELDANGSSRSFRDRLNAIDMR